ncbi:MAG: SpoIIIAC/SpoIIIAD family protein [Eubacteriales bacterium]
MEDIKVCGIVLCALCVCIVFKNIKSEYSLFIRLAITVSITLIALSALYPVLLYINEISSDTSVSKYLPTMIKALGVAVAVEITSDICKDAGENAIAERVSLFGRAEILILAIPMIKDLFSLCDNLLR